MADLSQVETFHLAARLQVLNDVLNDLDRFPLSDEEESSYLQKRENVLEELERREQPKKRQL